MGDLRKQVLNESKKMGSFDKKKSYVLRKMDVYSWVEMIEDAASLFTFLGPEIRKVRY